MKKTGQHQDRRGERTVKKGEKCKKDGKGKGRCLKATQCERQEKGKVSSRVALGTFWPGADEGSVEITEQMNRRKERKERQQRQQMSRENRQRDRQGDTV